MGRLFSVKSNTADVLEHVEEVASVTVDITSGVGYHKGRSFDQYRFWFLQTTCPNLSFEVRLFADDAILYYEVTCMDGCQVGLLQSDFNIGREVAGEFQPKQMRSSSLANC